MATEIVIINATRELTETELKETLRAFHPAPAGFHEARWAKLSNDARLTIGFFTWDSIEHHVEFTVSPQSSALATVVQALPTTMPLKFIHVYFKQGLPSFESASIIDLITLKRHDEILTWDIEVIDRSIKPFVDVASQKGLGMIFYGPAHEDPTELIILFGWESLEARETLQAHETWTKFLESTSPAGNESRLLVTYPFREERNV